MDIIRQCPLGVLEHFFAKINFVRLIFKKNLSIILWKISIAECGVSNPSMKGGDANVVRTSIFTMYLHTTFVSWNNNYYRGWIICSTNCYNKKTG